MPTASTCHGAPLRRRSAALIAGLFAAIGMAAPAAAAETLVFGNVTTFSLSQAPIVVAGEMGLFAEEGLEVERIKLEGSAALIPQIAAGRVHIGYPNPDILIISRQPGRDHLPLKFFYNATRESAWEIVVPEASPIKAVADLKGTKLGVGALTWGNIPITKAILKNAGLTAGTDVELLPVGTGAPAFRALTSDQVAALNLFDVQHALLEQSGVAIRRLPLEKKFLDLFSNGFVAHEDLIANKPDAIKGFGRAMAKATVVCEARPDACVRMFWKAYPEQKPTQGTEAEQVANGVKAMRARFDKWVAFPAGERRYGEFPEQGWRDFVEVLHSVGQISTDKIDIASLYTGAFVADYNDFDAEAVRAAAMKLP